MQHRNASTAPRAIRRAIVLAALLAALPAAQARDQQATGAQLDNALSWGTGASGAYAQVPVQTPRHAHRNYR